MAGSVAVVLGFPLLLMIGMLGMHRVEQLIDKVRRPPLRLVPDLDDDPGGEIEEEPGPPPPRLLRLIVSHRPKQS